MRHLMRMRLSFPLLLAVTLLPVRADAQVRPDTTKRDTALIRELERLLRDSTQIARPDYPRQTPGQLGGQSMNPDFSAIGEFLIDLSPKQPRVIEEGKRAEVREVELGIQAVVDPFFRADFFLGAHPEGLEIEEAYLTALSLPGGFQAKVGQFHVPIGKVNLIHRPEQITIDYPWMIREFFGPEGLKSSGIGLSKIMAPLGFFQELHVYGVGSIAAEEEHGAEQPEEQAEVLAAPNRIRDQVALIAQFRNYWDLSEAANAELGFSYATGKVRELEETSRPATLQEVFENQRYYGAHLTLRWRPLQQGLYRSLVWNNEILVNDGHEGKRLGAFSQAQWQLTRRTYLGGRFDLVEEGALTSIEGDEVDGGWLKSGSGYFTFFPSEFSRIKLSAERLFGSAAPVEGKWRAVIQTTFAVGPHRPHAF